MSNQDTETYTIDDAKQEIGVLVEEIQRLKASFEAHEHKSNGDIVLRYNG